MPALTSARDFAIPRHPSTWNQQPYTPVRHNSYVEGNTVNSAYGGDFSIPMNMTHNDGQDAYMGMSANAQPFQTPRQGSSRISTHLQSNIGKQRSGANSRARVLDKSRYKVGMILRAPHHEPLLDHRVQPGNPTRTESRYGAISSKSRTMIVVGLYHNHCICIPLFTHNGYGAKQACTSEYVSVLDDRYNGPFHPHSKHEPLITRNMDSRGALIDTQSVAHLTYPVGIRYNFAVIVEGELEPESTEGLLRLFEDFSPKAGRRR